MQNAQCPNPADVTRARYWLNVARADQWQEWRDATALEIVAAIDILHVGGWERFLRTRHRY